jgi:hypothetical protein
MEVSPCRRARVVSMKCCLAAVVFGIIIDTFGDLRGQAKDKQDDMNGVCFICGISRDEFDRNANGFEDHTEHDHNVWLLLAACSRRCGICVVCGRFVV